MSSDSFAHLHVHTEYSMLDGASLLDGLFERVNKLGMSSIAMTDHGNLHGAFDFWSKAKKHGVKPIIGIEAYLTPGTHRSERKRVRWGKGDLAEEGGNDVAGGGAYTHMTMWAETTEGMHNLFRLASLASLEGYYYKPRMDRELLQRYAKGIIASTGCLSGEIQTRLTLGQYDEALAAAGEFQDIFGKDNFYLELMDHGIAAERATREDLLRIAKTLGLELAEVEQGRAVFVSTPVFEHYNAIGTVHAGYTATLLDSCMACAVLSALPKGTGFTTMEFKVSLLRPLTKETGIVRAEGTLLSRGRRGATAEGRLSDANGKLLAHATTTCLIFEF